MLWHALKDAGQKRMCVEESMAACLLQQQPLCLEAVLGTSQL